MAQIKTNLQYGVTGSLQTGSIAGDAIDGTKIADDAINSEHLAAGGIDTAHIADDQITLAKMAAGTDGNIITYDASGNPAVVAVGTSGHFLKSQGAGSVPVFAAAGGGITHAYQWRLNTSFTGDADPIASNLEEVDSRSHGILGASMTESSGVFTFPVTGYWLVTFAVEWAGTVDSIYCHAEIKTSHDATNWYTAAQCADNISYDSGSTHNCNAHLSFIMDIVNTSLTKVKFLTAVANDAITTLGFTDDNRTYMTFIRLGDT